MLPDGRHQGPVEVAVGATAGSLLGVPGGAVLPAPLIYHGVLCGMKGFALRKAET